MANLPPATSEIKRRLIESIAAERRGTLVFSFLTVLLTPAFLVLSVFILLLASTQEDISDRITAWEALWDGGALVNATAGFLGLCCVMFFVKPGDHPRMSSRDLLWLGAGLALFGGILYLCYGNPLRQTNPRAFWPIYGGLATVLLGILGRGYVPRDHYYVRPGEWSIADPPYERKADQAEFWFGWASAFPGLLLGSYGDLFGSWWLWQGLGDHGLWSAAEVLHSLGSRDGKGAENRLRAASPKESGRVLRWLLRLRFVRSVDGKLGLTSAGERFLGISEWTVV